MFDLTFHAIEYAAYQPYLSSDQPAGDIRPAERQAQPGRYQSLPPASPRVSPVQPFASRVVRLVERILAAIQHVGAHIFPRAGSAAAQARQGNTGSMAAAPHAAAESISDDHESDSGYETAPDDSSNSIESSNFEPLPIAGQAESNKAYWQACEDSLRALEAVFREKEPQQIFEQVANFCECQRVMADLKDASAASYLASLKSLIGESGLAKLSACQRLLHRWAGNRNLSPERQSRLHYMCKVVTNLIDFANLTTPTLVIIKSGTPVT